MEQKTILTLHAFDRVAERLHLTDDEVREIIDQEKTILLGFETLTRKIHLLFYSVADAECFVAVQDERTKEVITVLPFDFDAYRTTFYTKSKFHRLKQRAMAKMGISIDEPPVVNKKRNLPNHFCIVNFRNPLTNKVRSKSIKFEAEEFPGGKQELEKDKNIHAVILKFIEAYRLPHEVFDMVVYALGRKGSHEPFAFEEDEESPTLA